jgi:hypothetical protein
MADEPQQPDATDDAVTLEPAQATSPRRRTLALVGVLAAVAVAVGAVAVTRGDDGDGRLPIALGDAAGGGRSESAAMSADMAYGGVHYVAGDDLPDLGGRGPAYKLSGSVSEDEVRALAEVFRLEGNLRHEDDSWMLETQDGSLYVYEAGGGSWSYSSAPPFVDGGGGGSTGSDGSCPADATPEEAERCAAMDGGNASSASGVVETKVPTTNAADTPVSDIDPTGAPEPFTPPEDLPSEAEARQIGLDLLASTGMDVTDATVTVDGPYDAWYVNVEPVIDGMPVTGMAASASVGPDGDIMFASGYLSVPETVGDYDLVTTRAAIDRLNEQMMVPFAARTEAIEDVGGTDGSAPPEPGVASEEPTTSAAEPTSTTPPECLVDRPVEDLGSDTTAGGDDVVATTLVDPCSPSEPYIPPEPIEVVLHSATRSLLLVPSYDGSNDMYLVPAYRFPYEVEEGGPTWVDAVAIAEEALAPVTTTPASGTMTVGTGPAVDAVEPVDGPAVAEE